jgi:hypothetical protein
MKKMKLAVREMNAPVSSPLLLKYLNVVNTFGIFTIQQIETSAG